jgi:predicted hotdog family 3-hydroxylacyl-ACP dehydratase
MTEAYPHPRELAPHAAPMLLIDRVVEAGDRSILAQSVITASNIFFMPGRGLPSYVAFELMAQTVSILDGWRRRKHGEGPQVGFLVGCRKYRVARDWFSEGDVLDIACTALIDEGEMRSFECLVSAGGVEMATGTLNVYRPDDPAKYLAESLAQ